MDLQFENHGSIWLLRPLTDLGRDWLAENIHQDAQTLGEAIAVEPRYVEAIATGAAGDGLQIGAA